MIFKNAFLLRREKKTHCKQATYSYVQNNSSLTLLMCLSTDFGRNCDTNS